MVKGLAMLMSDNDDEIKAWLKERGEWDDFHNSAMTEAAKQTEGFIFLYRDVRIYLNKAVWILYFLNCENIGGNGLLKYEVLNPQLWPLDVLAAFDARVQEGIINKKLVWVDTGN
jgi:hypothetical protein